MARAKVGVDVETSGAAGLPPIAGSFTELNQALEIGKKALYGIEQASAAATRGLEDLTQVGSMFEQFSTQFETLLKTESAALERMDELFEFAKTTPFIFTDVVDAGKAMQAYGIYTEEALRTIGDAAAAMGKTLEQGVDAVAGASQGVLIRLKQFGISSAMLTAELGHNINRETEEGLKELTDATLSIMEKRFGGGMYKLSLTMTGIISNIEGAWITFKKEVEDAGAFEAVKQTLNNILTIIDDLFATGKAQKLGKLVGETIAEAFIRATIIMADATEGILRAADAVVAFTEKDITAPDVRGIITGAGPTAGGAIADVSVAVGKGIGAFFRNIGRPGEVIGSINDWLAGPEPFVGPPAPRQSALIDAADLAHQMGEMQRELLAEFQSGGLRTKTSAIPPIPPEIEAPMMSPFGQDTGTAFWDITEDDVQRVIDNTEKVMEIHEDSGEQWADLQASLREASVVGWDSYYAYVKKQAMDWRTFEDWNIKNVVGAVKFGAKEMAAAAIDAIGKEAKVRALEEAYKALASYPDPGGMAAHTAAAFGFAALGGVAASISGAITGSAERDAMASEQSYTSQATVASDTEAPGSSTISHKQNEVVRQEVHMHLQFNFHGPAVFGFPGGWQQFRDDVVRPSILQLIDNGDLALRSA